MDRRLQSLSTTMPHDASGDDVVDALAAVLRDFGSYAFDLPRQDARRTAALFERWSQHVVAGVEPPGGAGKTLGRRDYPGLRRAFRQHREAERTEMTQVQDSLRDVVWAFVGGLSRVVTEDAADDVSVRSSLSQLSSRLGASSPDELRAAALEAVSQVQSVFEARRERRQSHLDALAQKLEALGTQLELARKEDTLDPLTQLYNRRSFDEQLARTVELASLRAGGAALLLVELDQAPQVASAHGPKGSDAAVVAVSHACVRVFKRKGDFVARARPEVLAVLLRDLDGAELGALAEKLRAHVAALEVMHRDARLTLTVSVGAAFWARGEAGPAWLERAEQALRAAQQRGRNAVVVAP